MDCMDFGRISGSLSSGQEWAQDLEKAWNAQNGGTLRMNVLSADLGKLQQGLEAMKLSTQGLEARGDTLLSHLSSIEAVVQSVQDRLNASPEGSPRAPRVEIQELLAMSESRTLQRSKSEVEHLRLQMTDLRNLLNDGLDARAAATGDVERKLVAMQDAALALRTELNSVRGESQEASIREARLGAEVRSLMAARAKLG